VLSRGSGQDLGVGRVGRSVEPAANVTGRDRSAECSSRALRIPSGTNVPLGRGRGTKPRMQRHAVAAAEATLERPHDRTYHLGSSSHALNGRRSAASVASGGSHNRSVGRVPGCDGGAGRGAESHPGVARRRPGRPGRRAGLRGRCRHRQEHAACRGGGAGAGL
jgi:hypothetical protein